jgi:hypothetical protein
MAEFCRKCAGEHGFFADLTIKALGIEEGSYMAPLCEGCGSIFIVNKGGEEFVFRSEKMVVF